MTLRELKKSTLYQSSDLDDMEVYVTVARNGKRQIEQLSFTGFSTINDIGIILLGGLTETVRMIESDEMATPEGYKPYNKQLYLEF